MLGISPSIASAQTGKSPRLCFVTLDPGMLNSSRYGTFFKTLNDLGYIDGQTIAIDYLSAEGRAERFPALAADCIHRRADVIVVTTTPAAQAAKRATTTIPIVMHPLGDPVGTGLVKSLAQPGGNVTGMSFMAPGMAAKRLELLREAVPQMSRVLVLTHLADPIAAPQIEQIKKAAQSFKITPYVRDIKGAGDLTAAFEAGARERVEGVVHTSESIFFIHRAQLVELAGKYRLPAIYHWRQMVEAGGLMFFAPEWRPLAARAAVYVDRILKGARPADLPVEQPTTFDLAINLKTARALGLTIPPALLLRAETIE